LGALSSSTTATYFLDLHTLYDCRRILRKLLLFLSLSSYLGFSILAVSQLAKSKPLIAELLSEKGNAA
jgi:hypothetical protein